MNKTFLLVLAVCLVSAHAFVKRDAPEAPKNDISSDDKITQAFSDIAEGIKKQFDPAVLQKQFGEVMEGIGKAFENLKPKDAPKA